MGKFPENESESSGDNHTISEDDNSLTDGDISSSSDSDQNEQDEEDEEERTGRGNNKELPPKKDARRGYGKNWLYFAHVKSDEHLKQMCQQNYLAKTGVGPQKQVYFTCYRWTAAYRRTNPHSSCPMRALYIPDKQNLYVKSRHDHPLANNAGKPKLNENEQSKKDCDKGAIVCSGERWPFFTYVEDYGHFLEICRQNCLIKTIKRYRKYYTANSSGHSFVALIMCKRITTASKSKKNCPIQGIYIPARRAFYLKNKHNHPLEAEDTADANIVGNKYVDFTGQQWSLLSHVNGEQELAKLCKKQWLNQTKTYRNTNCYKCQHCVALSKWPIKQLKYCPYRTIFYKPNSSMYFRGAHNHPLVKEKKMLPKACEPYVDGFGKVWRYVRQFQKNISMAVLKDVCRQKYQLTTGRLINNKMYFGCIYRRYKKPNSQCQCQYRGIFLTKNSCLYVCNEHNHKENAHNETTNPNADHVDIAGRIYSFLANIKNEKDLKEICEKNWLIKNDKAVKRKRNVHFMCSTSSKLREKCGGKKPISCCQIRAIFVSKKSALFVSKEGHNHALDGGGFDEQEAEEEGGEVFIEEEEASDDVVESDSDMEEEEEDNSDSDREEEVGDSNGEEEDESHDDYDEKEEEECEDEVDEEEADQLEEDQLEEEWNQLEEYQLEGDQLEEEEYQLEGDQLEAEGDQLEEDQLEEEEDDGKGEEPPEDVKELDEDEDGEVIEAVRSRKKLKNAEEMELSPGNELELEEEEEERDEFVDDQLETALQGHDEGEAPDPREESRDSNDLEEVPQNAEEEEKPRKDVPPVEMEKELDVQIVRDIIRDYKWLPGMKKEGEERRMTWPIITIEEPNDYEGEMPAKRQQKISQRVKKEMSNAGTQPNPMLPSTSGAREAPQAIARNGAPQYWWQQQGPAEPPKRLLRERKARINYGK